MKFFNLILVLACILFSQEKSNSDYSSILSNYISNENFSGVVLIGNLDTIIYHEAAGYKDARSQALNETSTRFRIASISKQFTAAALLLLEKSDDVQFDNPIIDYIPELIISSITSIFVKLNSM